jgi:hypothetical protein
VFSGGPWHAHQGFARDGGGVVRDAEVGGGVAARAIATRAARVDEIVLAVAVVGACMVEGVARVVDGGSVVRHSGRAVLGRAAAAASSAGVGEVAVEAAGMVIWRRRSSVLERTNWAL